MPGNIIIYWVWGDARRMSGVHGKTIMMVFMIMK